MAGKLEERGLMTDFGRKKIEEAKKNGQWDAPVREAAGRPDLQRKYLEFLRSLFKTAE